MGGRNMAVITQSAYQTLTEQTAKELVRKLGLFDQNEELNVREIGDGNLNYVFQITNPSTNKRIIVKQALPYAKVVGESWPLTVKRATIEANALKIFKSYNPKLVPEVYYSDEQLAVTVMEDLSHLTIARTGLIKGESYPLLSKHIGEYLAKTLFFTSDFYLHPTKKKELAKQFVNPELCKITEDLVFTDPFFDRETNAFEERLSEDVQQLWEDDELKLEVAKLKKAFLTEQEALLHGDLHTGSIFAGSLETKIIDPEFAFYGPMGFDTGQYFGNLIFQAITRNGEKRAEILTSLKEFWETFEIHFTELWNCSDTDPYRHTHGYLQSVLNKIFQDTLGFAGCELIRRTIGLAHVKDLDGIQDESKRIQCKKMTLSVGKMLIKNREEHGDQQSVLKSLNHLLDQATR